MHRSETTSAYGSNLGPSIVGWTRAAVEHQKKFVVFNDEDWGLYKYNILESYM